MLTFDEFKKIEITVGKILSAEKVQETDKLLKLMVDFGVKQNPSTPPKAVPRTEAVHLSHSKMNAQGLAKLQVFASHPFAKGEADTPLTPPSKEGGEQTSPEGDVRQIISGIAEHFPQPVTLVGKKCMFVTNLEPRTIRGLESNGMLLAVSTEDGKFSLLEPNDSIPEGTRAK